jgi:hypothetical protein
MGNLSPGIPAPFQKGARITLGRSPGGVDQTVPTPVAIPRNEWSRSIGIGGRNHSETVVGITRNAQSVSQRCGRCCLPVNFRGRVGEQEFGPNDPFTARLLNDLAEIYRALGKYGEAEPLYKRALPIVEKALGSEHPRVATSLINLAGRVVERRDYDRHLRLAVVTVVSTEAN